MKTESNCSYLVLISTSCSSPKFTTDKISIAFGDDKGNQVLPFFFLQWILIFKIYLFIIHCGMCSKKGFKILFWRKYWWIFCL